jgi:2-polyprenyl-6-methoxyphenol hydroxylase-like FAD-dependent oxidoreductase
MKVLVCGGGIGGASTALSLQAAGIEVDVFEAEPEIRELGVGINVLPHAVRELTELGLADELAATGLATSATVMFNRHGQKIWADPAGLADGYMWPQYSIHRGRLLGLLYRACLERLGAGRYHTGKRAVEHSQDASGVSLRFADGSEATGDVLVGADGLGSVIRSQLYPDEDAPLWNGVTMFRGIAHARAPLDGRSMVLIGRAGRRAVIYPISAPDEGGRSQVNLVLDAQIAKERPMPRQDWHHEVDRDQVRELFAEMRFDWVDLVALIDSTEQWWQYPMVDRDPLPRWSFGRVTLMGDAAHPMYPVGSNGASQAIVDARTLAYELALKPDLDEALVAYEAARRPTTSAVVEANRDLAAVKCMEIAEERAPDGFTDVDEVFAPGELQALSDSFKQIAGFDPVALNERPSLSARQPQAG